MTPQDIVRAKEWLIAQSGGWKKINPPDIALEIISAYEKQEAEYFGQVKQNRILMDKLDKQEKSNEEMYQKGRRVEIERYEKQLAELRTALDEIEWRE